MGQKAVHFWRCSRISAIFRWKFAFCHIFISFIQQYLLILYLRYFIISMFLNHLALQGSHLGSQTRLAIRNAHAFCTARKWEHSRETEKNYRAVNVVWDTGDSTGVSERIAYAIAKEGMTKGWFASPERNYEGRRLPAAESAPTSRWCKSLTYVLTFS